MGQARGQVVISVDLELALEQGSLSQQRALEGITSEMLALVDRYQFPATFAVADPARSAAVEAITAAHLPHEIAVLGDATWIGPGAGRERLTRELQRRFAGAREAGLQVSSLALRHCQLTDHLDLLPKNAIAAVRTEPVRRGEAHQPSLLRFGVWQSPATLRLPQPSSWWFGNRHGHAITLLNRAARSGEVVHLLVDAASLISDAVGVASLQKVFNGLQRLREKGALEVLTLENLIQAMSRPRDNTPARSILKAA